MIYKIVELSTEVQTSLTYILVEFWLSQASLDSGDPPHLTEEFRMQLSDETTGIEKSAKGEWIQTDRIAVDVGGILGQLREDIRRGVATEDDFDTQLAIFNTTSWSRVTTKVDVVPIIRQNILWYRNQVAVPLKLSGDHTTDSSKPLFKDGVVVRLRASAAIVRDKTDPKHVLARSDVQSLLGKVEVSVL